MENEEVRPQKCATAGIVLNSLIAADGKEGEFKEIIKGMRGPREIANNGLLSSESVKVPNYVFCLRRHNEKTVSHISLIFNLRPF